MRNLKRALSLAMASIMLLGLMVVGAGAASFDDFSDKDKIVNTEAVSILSTLNVINGKDDGSFDPTGIVTRAEMAKMICVILNGGKDPNLGSINTTTYTDTVGNWASAYIEYCTNRGIVSGDGTGKFNPTATVKGVEAAKMLLVALGYNANYEGMVGGQWDVATGVLANKNDLYENLPSLDPSEGLTRDDAAQMVYNALDANKVEYTNAFVTGTDGSLTSIPTVKELDGTLLTDEFKAVRVEGVVVANGFATLGSTKQNDDSVVIGAALDSDKTKITVTNGEDQDKYTDNTSYTFTVASGEEALGRSVSLYVKPSTTSEKSTVIGGVIVSSDNKVITSNGGDKLTTVADDNDMEIVSATAVYANYGTKLTTSSVKDDKTTNNYAGVEKILVDHDNDGKVDYAFLNTYELGKVTKYSTKDDGSISVVAGTTYKADDEDDVVGFDDVSKDDYVLAAFMGGKLYVEKAETVTGDLTAYKTDSSLTVDGTKYDISKVPTHNDLAAAASYGNATTLKAAATFYLDKAGRVIAVGDPEENAYSYAFVWGVSKGSSIGHDEIKLTLQDGTTSTYVVNSKSTVKVENTTAVGDGTTTNVTAKGLVLAYSLTSDNEVKLNFADDDYSGTNAKFEKGKTAVKITAGTNSGTTKYANANTTFFYVTMSGANVDKVSVYTGYANAPKVDSLTSGAIFMAENASDKITAVAFTGASAAADAADHLFLYKTGSTTSDYVEAYVFLNGKDEEEVIQVSDVDSLTDLNDLTLAANQDKLYTYSVNTDGYYELEAVPNGALEQGAIANNPKTTVVINGNEYKLTSDTVVIDNVGDPGTPSAVFNGSVEKGDIVSAVVDADNGEALMIVIGFAAGETMTSPSASDLTNALATSSTVIVSGNVPAVTVPSGKTLVLTGNLGTIGAITNNGTVELNAITLSGSNNLSIAANDVKVTGINDLTGTGRLTLPTNTTYATGAGFSVKDGAKLTLDGTDVTAALTGGDFTVKHNGAGTDYIFNDDITLGANLTVAANDTLTVATGVKLDTNGHTLTIRNSTTINGTLDTAAAELTIDTAGQLHFAVGSTLITSDDIVSKITGANNAADTYTCTTAGTETTAVFSH